MLDHGPNGFWESGQRCTLLGSRDRRFTDPPTHVHCEHYHSKIGPCCGCKTIPSGVSPYPEGGLGSLKVSELFKILRERRKDLEEAFELLCLERDYLDWPNNPTERMDYQYSYCALTEDTVKLHGVFTAESGDGTQGVQRFCSALPLMDFLYRYPSWLRAQYARLEELRHERTERDQPGRVDEELPRRERSELLAEVTDNLGLPELRDQWLYEQ